MLQWFQGKRDTIFGITDELKRQSGADVKGFSVKNVRKIIENRDINR